MATKAIYITVRLDIENDKAAQITNDDVQEIVSEIEYSFGNVGDFKITDTEICGIND